MTTPTLAELREAWKEKIVTFCADDVSAPHECDPLRFWNCALRVALDHADALAREVAELRATIKSQWMPVCGDTGELATEQGNCPTHNGDACLVVQEMFDLQRENAELRADKARAIELIDDLRSYLHDWDWKYGEEWDRERAAIDAARGKP